MKDYYNNDIVLHDIISYPVRSGSSLWIEEALVTGFTEEGLKIEKAGGTKTRLKNIGNCFVCRPPSMPQNDWTERLLQEL